MFRHLFVGCIYLQFVGAHSPQSPQGFHLGAASQMAKASISKTQKRWLDEMFICYTFSHFCKPHFTYFDTVSKSRPLLSRKSCESLVVEKVLFCALPFGRLSAIISSLL